DAVATRSGLPGRASARDVDDDVELTGRLGQLQRLAYNHAQSLVREILFERLAINCDLARAGSQVDARRRRLAPSRSIILHLSHWYSVPSNCGFYFLLRELISKGWGRCAVCGCSESA